MPIKMRLWEEGHQNQLKVWIQAFRLQYVPTSIFPAILGSVIAGASSHQFNYLYFMIIIIGVTLHHTALNMIDDIFDYLHAVDKSFDENKNPYTGGSGVLTGKLLSVNQMLAATVICYILAMISAIYFTITIGWPVLIFVGIGLFSSIFYSAPPIRYGYRGFGELGLFINFGPVICLGAYYVQTRSLTWEPFIISLIPGFLMWSMIVINEIPDYEEDSQAGKLNLVARLGKKNGILLYTAGLICAYGTILFAASFKLAPFNILLGLLSIPLAFNSFFILRKNYMDKFKMVPANLATIKVHALTLIFIIISYLIPGKIL